MLCNGVTRRIALDHEPGQWVEVRLLGYVSLEEAREARSLRVIGKVRAMGSEMLSSLPERPSNDVASTAEDPLADYDLPTLLREGIIAWSYDAPVTMENVDSLDEQTARLVGLALVPQPETEADRGNGFGRSTKRSTV